jgi:hypothetical protein
VNPVKNCVSALPHWVFADTLNELVVGVEPGGWLLPGTMKGVEPVPAVSLNTPGLVNTAFV